MNTNIPRIELQSGYSISRVIMGGWQLAGGHGPVDENLALQDMRAFVREGITTFDCADIYTGVEELIGKFIQEHKSAFVSGSLPPIQIHTKYVPDLDELPTLTKTCTEAIIDRSLKRLGVERLDMVQFHWWDYTVPGYIEAANHLLELKQAGKIRYISVTNFDALHLRKILEAGIPVVSNQVQYSVLDHRPEGEMQKLAQEHNFRLLCYGTIAGGFLSERWLHIQEPLKTFENRSLIKYRLIIEEFGGFDLFQRLLAALKQIAGKYSVGIAEVAARYILQKSFVAGVIIGARNTRYLEKIKKLGSFKLEAEDLQKIRSVVDKANGPQGPIFGLERDRTGPHGEIMKYNLNKYRES
jgi:aryl-alcohol dehydrogenase-like predicted oxidoreductase